MKLRNKKTGMIGEVGYLATSDGKIIVNNINNQDEWYEYNSLAELNDEWEDYEEPKEYWFIDTSEGAVVEHTKEMFELTDKERKQIGNYFETEEEAEKAVEKLKAWKRLKDGGVSFEVKVIDRKWYLEPKAEPQQRTFNESHDLFKDVMLFFGDEE